MKTVFFSLGVLVLSACSSPDGASLTATGSSIDERPAEAAPSPSPSPSPVPYAYSGGTGVIADPYILSVAEDVQRIGDNPAAYYSMNQSISMGATAFVPLPAFSGRILGNGFEIDNLTITVTDGSTAALFTSLEASAVVTGIKFYGSVISGNRYAAVVAGELKGRLSFCEVKGTVTSSLGGNGFSTGTGKPAYVTKTGTAVLVTNTQDVFFNGTHLTGAVN